MNEVRHSKKVSVEDLLQVKRSERPPAEFWANFERELRAKQLAAIVEKRPWWSFLSTGLAGVYRVRIPLGSAAVLAITLLGVNEYRKPAAVTGPAVAADSASSLVDRVFPEVSRPSESEIAAIAPDTAARATNSSVRELAVVADAIAPSVVAEGMKQNESAPSSLAASLAESNAVADSSFAALNLSSGFETRVLTARSSMTEPLSQLSSPKNVRLRDRYLGSAFSAGYSVENAAMPSGKVVDRLRDRTLRPEEFSRFDARGDRLSIKL